MLYQGRLIAVGPTEEFRASTHPRIRQFLERKSEFLAEVEGSFATAYLQEFLHEH
jgi:ABC-type transporter Mla maintaining outer membrane lipid asymmetry ATPase subunit MlaF